MATDSNENPAATSLSDGEIIDRFGGIRPMAAKLGVAVTTVQGWKVRGRIPGGRRQAILDAAAKQGVDLGGGGAPAKSPAPERKAKESSARPAPARTAPKPALEEPGEPETRSEEPEKPDETPGEAVETAPAPVAGPPPRPRGNGVAWLALLAALAVGFALVARPWWEPLVYPAAPAPGGNTQSAETVAEIRALSRAVDRLSGDLASRLDTLEGRIAAAERIGGEGGEGGELGPQLAALERSLTSLAGGLESIGATLAGLEARIEALESASTGVPGLIELAQRENAAVLDALERELAALHTSRAESQKIQEDVNEGIAAALEHLTALGARVGELESRPVQTGEKIADLVLAIGQVKAVFDSGRPFRSELDGLKRIASDDPLILEGGAIATLSQWADRGLDSRATLRRRFDRIAPNMTRELKRPPGDGLLEQVWHSVTSLVIWRPTDEGAPHMVSSAEAALTDNELAAAVDALSTGALGADGNEWLADARARLDAEAELAALHARVIVPLAGAADSKPGEAGPEQGAAQ